MAARRAEMKVYELEFDYRMSCGRGYTRIGLGDEQGNGD
jgi:hypothetical protein